MPEPLRVLAIAGSLRRASYNRGLVRAAADEAPPGMLVEPFEIRDIPLYDGDLEADTPAPVQALRERMAMAGALLVASPEYNFSVPGVLKNAIDWASRARPSVLKGKPVAVLGASPGAFGTIRGQTHLRWVLYGLGSLVMPPPELFIPNAASRFDDSGNLTDPETRRKVRELLERLSAWAARFA